MNTDKTNLPSSLQEIDVNFDFTSDTPRFWDGFWGRNGGFGAGGADPDARSQMARRYHQLLWSRELPNGETMVLEDGRSRFYLKWKDIWFGSDSITASFRYDRNRVLLKELEKQMGLSDYRSYVENYLRELYTIGGMMLLPSFRWCLNQARGCSLRISDRWDLTLECIRQYYLGESSPLEKCLNNPTNQKFFSLFVDFKGFVDFFFLQDCVSDDYQKVSLWLDTSLFETNPIPKTINDYLAFIDTELDFVDRRNKRIAEFCKGR